jgi:hypothetical protein
MFENRRNRANKLESSSLERQGFAILLGGSNFINIHQSDCLRSFQFLIDYHFPDRKQDSQTCELSSQAVAQTAISLPPTASLVPGNETEEATQTTNSILSIHRHQPTSSVRCGCNRLVARFSLVTCLFTLSLNADLLLLAFWPPHSGLKSPILRQW